MHAEQCKWLCVQFRKTRVDSRKWVTYKQITWNQRWKQQKTENTKYTSNHFLYASFHVLCHHVLHKEIDMIDKLISRSVRCMREKNIVFHYSTEQHSTAQHINRAYYSGWTKFCKWNVKWNHYKYKRWKKTSMAHKSAFSLSIDGPQANLLERKFH